MDVSRCRQAKPTCNRLQVNTISVHKEGRIPELSESVGVFSGAFRGGGASTRKRKFRPGAAIVAIRFAVYPRRTLT